MLANGQNFRYQSTDWSVTFAKGPQDIISEAASAIQVNGLHVRSNSYETPGILAQIEGDIVGSYKYSVDLLVQVENEVGFGSADDAASLIDHAVYEITGHLPTHSVPQIMDAGGKIIQTTGPDVKVPPDPNKKTWEDSIVEGFKNLTSKGMWALGLVGLGIVVALFLITQAPMRRAES